MKIRVLVPNLFTAANLLCGALGIIYSFQAQLEISAWLIIIAAFLDFLDGFVARAIKGQSDFGKQFDSLADAITFGVLPAIMLFQYLSISFNVYFTPLNERTDMAFWMPLTALLVAVFSAVRLGIFNVDETQSDKFMGLPTPANALFIASFSLMAHYQLKHNFYHFYDSQEVLSIVKAGFWNQWKVDLLLLFQNAAFWLLIVVLSCLVLVARVPLIAFKFKSIQWAENKDKFILIGSLLLVIVIDFLPIPFLPTFGFLLIPLGILIYILVSIITHFTFKKQ